MLPVTGKLGRKEDYPASMTLPPTLLAEACAYAAPFYDVPERAYHNLRHVEQMLSALEERGVLTPELELAVWGHDLVYDARANDNEERSAAQFDAWLAGQGADAKARARIRALILATKHAAPPQTREEMLLVDADLSILGAPQEQFDAYHAAIRREYAHVPAPLYAIGRHKVLRGFLEREHIFSTPEFAALEAQAQANLRRVIRL